VRLHYLIPVAVGLASVLIAEAAFMLTVGGTARVDPSGPATSDIGQTASIGTGLFTEYLLPFEITSVLILMALVGAITLARRTAQTNARDGSTLGQMPELIPAVETPIGAGAILQPGQTAATGQAMAEYQIEHGEASVPAREGKE
jgi:hypothetical protein